MQLPASKMVPSPKRSCRSVAPTVNPWAQPPKSTSVRNQSARAVSRRQPPLRSDSLQRPQESANKCRHKTERTQSEENKTLKRPTLFLNHKKCGFILIRFLLCRELSSSDRIPNVSLCMRENPKGSESWLSLFYSYLHDCCCCCCCLMLLLLLFAVAAVVVVVVVFAVVALSSVGCLRAYESTLSHTWAQTLTQALPPSCVCINPPSASSSC